MTILFVLFSLLGELRSTQNDYGTLDGLWFVALTMPRMAYQVFPVSALLGALVGLGGLAAANELVAFRTAGISRLRLALAALAGTLLLTVPVMIMGEWLAPAAEQQARAFRLSEMVGQAIIGGSRGVWMRDGPDIVNIQRPLLYADRGGQTVEFNDVVGYQFSDHADLEAITRAGSADHREGRWTLNEVSRVEFGAYGAALTRATHQDWATDVRPELLDSAVTRPKFLSLRSLWDYLAYLGENGLDEGVYQDAFWERDGDGRPMFGVIGFSFSGNAQNTGMALVRLKDWDQRRGPSASVDAIAGRAMGAFMQIKDALVFAFAPPAVPELGTSAGFLFYLKDNGGLGHEALLHARNQLLGASMQSPLVTKVRPAGQEDTPKLRLDIDYEKAAAQGVPNASINATLGAAWGGLYVDDFIDRGRVKRVYVQSDAPFRMVPDDFKQWSVRNAKSDMVPPKTLFSA